MKKAASYWRITYMPADVQIIEFMPGALFTKELQLFTLSKVSAPRKNSDISENTEQ